MNTILFMGEHARTFNVQWHSHDQWELVSCTSGEGTFLFKKGYADILYAPGGNQRGAYRSRSHYEKRNLGEC